MQAQGISPQTY